MVQNKQSNSTELQKLSDDLKKLSPEQRQKVILSILPTMIFRVHELTQDDKIFREKTLEIIKDYK